MGHLALHALDLRQLLAQARELHLQRVAALREAVELLGVRLHVAVVAERSVDGLLHPALLLGQLGIFGLELRGHALGPGAHLGHLVALLLDGALLLARREDGRALGQLLELLLRLHQVEVDLLHPQQVGQVVGRCLHVLPSLRSALARLIPRRA